MENLALYEMARAVPENALKKINAGRLKGMSDINPMWRFKKLTEMFGPCGTGWWYEITDRRIVDDALTNQRAAFVDVLLYYKHPETGEISHGIPGTGGSSFVAQESRGAYLSDECYKMALTDAISVAAKALGVAADVYFSADRTKYSSPPNYGPAPQQPPTAPQQQAQNQPIQHFVCANCGGAIKPYRDGKGNEVGVRQHVNRAVKMFGQPLCLDCIKHLYPDAVQKDEKPT